MTRSNSPWRVKRKAFHNHGPLQAAAAKVARLVDVTALDAMIAARPLTPPPMPQWHDTRSAAKLALASEIRKGTYVP